MTELAYIVHQIPGRVRLRIKHKRRDRSYFDRLSRQLQPLDCIEDVRVNCNTGSIILCHRGQPYSAVETELRKLELFEIVGGPEPATPAPKPLLSSLSRTDRLIEEQNPGLLNLRTLVLIAIVLLAVQQVRRGAFLGLALPLLWNGLELVGRFNDWLGDAVDKDR